MELNILKTRDDGLTEIHNPTIDKIEPGMMIRYGKNKDGLIVAEINRDEGLVLIGDSIGGTAERWDWHPVSEVKVVWKIRNSFAEAMQLIGEFNGEIMKRMNL